MVLAYRGGDLTLQTPTNFNVDRAGPLLNGMANSGPGWLGPALEQAENHGHQLWVDGTVLKCCNQAYDLAVAHRAPEVRLEHLVHAMTLIPSAVEILRSEGVSDATLRRESGIIIAHDIPSVHAKAEIAPATSDEMEETLRHAASRAYRMRSPVTIDDILQTLFDMTRDIPTRNLLSRHRADWTIRDPLEGRRDHDVPRDRIRLPNRSAQYSEVSEQMIEPPSRTDTYQNTRIDELERTVGQLTDLLQKLTDGGNKVPEPAPQPAPREQRPSGNSDVQNALLDRVGDVETTVDRRFRELARTWNVLGDRLQTMEDMLFDGNGAQITSTPELRRLSENVERLRSLETLPGRLERVENLARKFDRLDTIDKVVEKLERLDRADVIDALEKKLTAVEGTFQRVLVRLDGLEKKLDSGVDGDFDLDPVRDKLEALEKTILDRSASGVDLGPMMDRFKEVESRLADSGLVLEAVGDRIDTFEGNVDGYRSQLAQTTSKLETEIKAIASAVSAQHSAGERLHALVNERFVAGVGGTVDIDQTALANVIGERVRETVDQKLSLIAEGGPIDQGVIRDAIETPMSSSLTELRNLMEVDRKEQRAQFEYLAKSLASTSGEQAQQDLTEVSDAMLKINANQQTLAQSMDRWRLDVSDTLGAVAQRLEMLEGRMAQPSTNFDELAKRVDYLTNQMTHREERRSGFLMWLFGTEDWWSDGWRTPEEREAAARLDRSEYAATDAGYQPIRPEDRALRG